MSRASSGRVAVATWILLVALAILAYAPFWTADRAFGDDFSALATCHERGLGADPRVAFDGGRPLYGLALQAAYSTAGGVRGLLPLRWIAALGLIAVAERLAAEARARGLAAADAALLAAGSLWLPSAMVVASWSMVFMLPWAALLALLSGSLFFSSRRREGATHLGRAALSGLGLLAALCIYQPASSLFWLPLVFGWILGPEERTTWAKLRRPLRALALWCVVGLVYLGIWRTYRLWLPPNPLVAARAQLVPIAMIGGKLRWFLVQPLANAFSVFVVPRSPAIALVAAAAVVAGTVTRARERRASIAGELLLLAAVLPLFYWSNLLVMESWAAYRTLLPLVLLAWTVTAIELRRLAIAALGQVRGRRSWIALMVAMLVGAAVADRLWLTPRIVEPQRRELALARRGVRRALAARCTRIELRQPAPWGLGEGRPLYDEVGLPSSSEAWVPRRLVDVLVREVTGSDFAGEVDVVPANVTKPPASRDPCVLDLKRLLARSGRGGRQRPPAAKPSV